MTTIHTTGRMIDPQTVRLANPLPDAAGEISLVVELKKDEKPNSADVLAAMEKIWEAQRLRGHIPPTREEVDEYIRSERESWGD